MSARLNAWRLVCAISALALPCMARAVDPFHTRRVVPNNAASPLLGEHAVCAFGPPTTTLTLQDVVERALCTNPDTRSAWAVVEERAAAVGVSKAAYLPTLSATGQVVHDATVTHVRDHPSLSTNYSTAVHSDNLSLSWILFDFGGRHAGLEGARALLAAATADEDASLQKAFVDAAKAYYSVQDARERLRIDEAISQDAMSSLVAARERSRRGVAPITEVFQAQTAYEQAKLDTVQDLGKKQIAEGSLAQVIALPPDTTLSLDDLDDATPADEKFSESVSKLIGKALESHPTIVAAEQSLRAAQAKVTEAKAQGRPTIRLAAQYSQNNQPVQLGLGMPHYPAKGHDGYVGLQVTIPLFSGFAASYQVRQAQAQVDQQSEALAKARQKVGLQVWTAYQTLSSDQQAVNLSAELQNVATSAWESAQRRYRSGVGTVLELLSTQTALAKARQQHVDALSAWRYDRLALAAALGQLGLKDLDVPVSASR